MAQAAPTPMCPIAETCKDMMEKPLSGAVLLIPGITFITVGVLIIIWPVILLLGSVPFGLIEDEDRMGTGRDSL